MIRLFKFGLLMLVFNVGIILVARQLGGSQPVKMPFETLFTDSGGAPCQHLCIVGVVVGSTSVGDIPRLFADHHLSQSLEMRRIGNTIQAWDGNIDEFMASYNNSGEIVNQITWSKTAHTPPYRSADALNLLGQPDCVQVGTYGYSFFYNSSKLLVSITRRDKYRLTPQDRINFVIIYGKNVVMDCLYTEPWRGFAGNVRYNLTP